MATTTMGSPKAGTKSKNIIFWIIGFVVILGAAWYLNSRDVDSPTTATNQNAVNTEARDGEIGSSGAVSEPADKAPERTNDPAQR